MLVPWDRVKELELAKEWINPLWLAWQNAMYEVITFTVVYEKFPR